MKMATEKLNRHIVSLIADVKNQDEAVDTEATVLMRINMLVAYTIIGSTQERDFGKLNERLRTAISDKVVGSLNTDFVDTTKETIRIAFGFDRLTAAGLYAVIVGIVNNFGIEKIIELMKIDYNSMVDEDLKNGLVNYVKTFGVTETFIKNLVGIGEERGEIIKKLKEGEIQTRAFINSKFKEMVNKTVRDNIREKSIEVLASQHVVINWIASTHSWVKYGLKAFTYAMPAKDYAFITLKAALKSAKYIFLSVGGIAGTVLIGPALFGPITLGFSDFATQYSVLGTVAILTGTTLLDVQKNKTQNELSWLQAVSATMRAYQLRALYNGFKKVQTTGKQLSEEEVEEIIKKLTYEFVNGRWMVYEGFKPFTKARPENDPFVVQV